MSELLDNFEKYLNSEDFKEYRNRQLFLDNLKTYYIERFRNFPNKEYLLDKLIAKYESDEYKDREYKLGYFPRKQLYDYIADYCVEFERLIETNDFKETYTLCDKYILEIFYGQGTEIYIKKI